MAFIHDRDITRLCRLAAVFSLFAACWWQAAIDAQLSLWWHALRTHPVFRHDSLEPLVVTVGFITSMTTFYFMDVWIPSAKRWRIQPEPYVLKTWPRELSARLQNEAVWYWMPIAVFDWLYPRRSLPTEGPGVWRLSTEVLAALMVYDALFFVCHVVFHKVSVLYKAFHAKHHTLKVLRATEAMRLTAVEEAVDVTCSIIAINLLGCHPFSRAVYNFVIVCLITELHSGYDCPWMLQNVVPYGIWAGSRRHDYHHRYGTRYYQKFFTYLDDLMDKTNLLS